MKTTGHSPRFRRVRKSLSPSWASITFPRRGTVSTFESSVAVNNARREQVLMYRRSTY